MKWTLKLVAESDSGETTVHEVAILNRAEAFIKSAALGMSIEENKQIAANIQACMVSDQVDRHNKALTACRFCGQRFRTNGYHSIFKSVFGGVPMRDRRVWDCKCRGAECQTFSSLATGGNPTSPELRYLTSKLAALMPFGKVADFLGELLPASAKTNANTARNRMMRVGCRLERSVRKPEISEADVTVPKVIVGFDGGYVLADGEATRFAFVRQGSGPEATGMGPRSRCCRTEIPG